MYKYLGIMLNSAMDPSLQWHHVEHQVNTLPYLLRQLKLHGWSQPMLITAYRAYGISHFTYSAPILTSCNDTTQNKMRLFQNKVLRICGLTPDEARDRYRIKPITDVIEENCVRILKRIVNDASHPLQAKLELTDTSRRVSYKVPFARTNLYQNSFLVKFLRHLNYGTTNKYHRDSVAPHGTLTRAREYVIA